MILTVYKPFSHCVSVSPWEVRHLYSYGALQTFLTMTLSRGLQCTSDQWWPILLGRDAFASTKCGIGVLGYRLVQSSGTGRCHDGYQVRIRSYFCARWYQLTYFCRYSYACANFISTASTLGTSYEPTPGKTIGIYAAVLCTQGMSFGLSFSAPN